MNLAIPPGACVVGSLVRNAGASIVSVTVVLDVPGQRARVQAFYQKEFGGKSCSRCHLVRLTDFQLGSQPSGLSSSVHLTATAGSPSTSMPTGTARMTFASTTMARSRWVTRPSRNERAGQESAFPDRDWRFTFNVFGNWSHRAEDSASGSGYAASGRLWSALEWARLCQFLDRRAWNRQSPPRLRGSRMRASAA